MNWRKQTIWPVLFFILHGALAQTATPPGVQNHSWNTEKANLIEQVIGEYVDKEWVNGAVAMVYQNNKLVYHKAVGYRDSRTKDPMRTDDIFRIASQTKLVTSLAVVLLADRGQLLLDDPISAYIPAFKNPKVLSGFNPADSSYTTVPAIREITIRDLLTHTSGIGYAQVGTPAMCAVYAKAGVYGGLGLVNETTLKDQMARLATAPLFNQPGEKYTYGLSIDLLGYLVETVSGKTLADFFKTEFFEPLGMTDTYFFIPKNKANRLVPLHQETKSQKVERAGKYFNIGAETLSDFPVQNGNYYSGGAGLSSTAQDYCKLLLMILNEGEVNGKRLISRAGIRMLTSNQIGILPFGANNHGNKFGFALKIITREGASYTPLSEGSLEGGGAFSSFYWIDPKEKIVAQFMVNLFPNSHLELYQKFQHLVYQSIK
jgi:CubicO group peptidase (beta-lactamase class C family)